MTLFNKHMVETEQERITRVRNKISKILAEEGLTFNVQMIPNIELAMVVKPKAESAIITPDNVVANEDKAVK